MRRTMIGIVLLALTTPTLGRDDGRYAQVNPEIKRWIEDLKDNFGVGCCDTADGLALNPDALDPEWSCDGDKCRVMIKGQWYDVPPRALLPRATQNKLGYPMVWFTMSGGVLTIHCFLRGTET